MEKLLNLCRPVEAGRLIIGFGNILETGQQKDCIVSDVTITIPGSVIQLTLWARIVLIIPYSVLKIHFQTIATAAGATTIGRKNTARKNVLPLILVFNMTATTRERKIPIGTVKRQK